MFATIVPVTLSSLNNTVTASAVEKLAKSLIEDVAQASASNVNVIVERIRRMGFFSGAQSGMYVAVLTAVEHALWDLAGKALDLPVYRLLGGKFRDKIRIYCDTASSSEAPEDMAKAAQEVVDHGFTAIKFDLDWYGDPGKWDRYNMTARVFFQVF